MCRFVVQISGEEQKKAHRPFCQSILKEFCYFSSKSQKNKKEDIYSSSEDSLVFLKKRQILLKENIWYT